MVRGVCVVIFSVASTIAKSFDVMLVTVVDRCVYVPNPISCHAKKKWKPKTVTYVYTLEHPEPNHIIAIQLPIKRCRWNKQSITPGYAHTHTYTRRQPRRRRKEEPKTSTRIKRKKKTNNNNPTDLHQWIKSETFAVMPNDFFVYPQLNSRC